MKSRKMEAYVDEILVKSVKGVLHTTDLREAFEFKKRDNLHLNLAKCVFRVKSGKVMGSWNSYQNRTRPVVGP